MEKFLVSKSNHKSSEVVDLEAEVRKEDLGLDGELEKKVNYVNREIFGNDSFRPYQKNIIATVLDNKDCFVIMPTGGGKSLCYQLPAVLSAGVTVVISPLLSLVEDQVSSLISLGVPAAYLSSTSSETMVKQVFQDLKRGDKGLEPFLKLLYITPERMVKNLYTKNMLTSLYQNEMLARFVIDEAHCVSAWGHDFRKEYGALGILKEDFPDTPIIALTATARSRVAEDTKEILRIQHAREYTLGYDRPNLKFEVCVKPHRKADANEFILDIIRTFPPTASGILYCMTKAECESLSDFLRGNAVKADYYHAGMAKGAKQMVQAKWLSGELNVVCATIAYGMGIDKPDVRYVIHQSIAKSMEGYYQEAGRAGRDGNYSECILLYRNEDVNSLARILSAPPRGKMSRKDEASLEEMVSYCMNTSCCRRKKFCEIFSDRKNSHFSPCRDMCDNCLFQIGGKSRRVFKSSKKGQDEGVTSAKTSEKPQISATNSSRAVFVTAAALKSQQSLPKPISSSFRIPQLAGLGKRKSSVETTGTIDISSKRLEVVDDVVDCT